MDQVTEERIRQIAREEAVKLLEKVRDEVFATASRLESESAAQKPRGYAPFLPKRSLWPWPFY